MNSALHPKPVYPPEDYEADLATFETAIKTAPIRPDVKPGMFTDWTDAAKVLVPFLAALIALAYLWVKS